METTETSNNWRWVDVYTKAKRDGEMTWVFRKRVAREGATFEELRVSIARLLGSSPAVPMSFDDFQLIKRP